MIIRGPKSGSKSTTRIRQRLRRDLTDPEKLFWAKTARKQFYGLKFRRQHGIGNYIVDFYIPERKLVIEIDGDTHAGKNAALKDKQRTDYLQSLGYRVLRYTNDEVVNNTDGVFQDLAAKLELN